MVTAFWGGGMYWKKSGRWEGESRMYAGSYVEIPET